MFAARAIAARIRRVNGRAAYRCYTDGSCKAGDGLPGGWGYVIYPPEGTPIEAYGKTSGQIAKSLEYLAVAEALSVLPEDASVTVFADNQSLVENLSKHLTTWRERSFGKVDPDIVDSVRRIDASITSKYLVVSWQWVRAHNGNVGNERADFLAAQGAREAKALMARR